MKKEYLPKEVIEQGFRWIREAISLMHEKHCHPLPMVALLFMYSETLGKGLMFSQGEKKPSTTQKVSIFIREYMPKLWAALEFAPNREEILSNTYRNGLAHQLFMKGNTAIHENEGNDIDYVLKDEDLTCSINVDFPVKSRYLHGKIK